MGRPRAESAGEAPSAVTVLDHLRFVWRSRLIILGITVTGVAIAFAVLGFQTKVYTARATILTPKETGSSSGLSASLGALLGGGGGGGREGGGGGGGFLPALLGSAPSVSGNLDMFAAVLRSRTSREEVIADLSKKYGAEAGSRILGVDVNTMTKGI